MLCAISGAIDYPRHLHILHSSREDLNPPGELAGGQMVADTCADI